MTEVSIKIKCCDTCPHMRSQRFHTANYFEYVQEWICREHKNQRITLFEMFDDKPEIPEWCPLIGTK